MDQEPTVTFCAYIFFPLIGHHIKDGRPGFWYAKLNIFWLLCNSFSDLNKTWQATSSQKSSYKFYVFRVDP